VTFEHIVTAHDMREGIFTSHELPRGMKQIPYTMPGDPELAFAVSAQAEGRDDTWVLASDDPYLPIFYGTVNIWSYLKEGNENWVSVGINQCAQTEDFLLLGELIGEAVLSLDRKVVLLASGGLSHRFLPFRQLRGRESSDPMKNIITPEAREADLHVLDLLQKGDHGAVIDWIPEYRKVGPEGKFGHYLIMAGALGGASCTATGELFSEYEASVGTGQVHCWFERPAAGWTGSTAAA
jgi:3,4-dihydroxyphenylacetate 2,3-dioxygenase